MLDKRYDHEQVEKGKYETWKEKGYFIAGKDQTKTPFCMVIPPPNVTGKLHLGHAWDTTLQDIIARYKKAKGYDVLWVPGMDHAGIATQAKVMELLRLNGVDVTQVTREQFLKSAWEWKDAYALNIHEQWAKLGLSLDYTRERFTLDEGLNKAVRIVFKNLYDKGLIYQGERIINWDPVQMTALSNVEVIHHDDPGRFYYFYYPLKDNPNEKLLVATTRPETMFGDVCLVVNPNDERYKSYIGKLAINPANDKPLPIIADDYVDIDFGTGCMKCTPAHDPNDFKIAERHNLAKPIIMNKNATMNSLCGNYAGMTRFACRAKLVADIKEKGLLYKIDEITHPVGHSERSGAIVEPMLSKQWFVKMRPLADNVLKSQKSKDKVNFIPARFGKVLTQWMENIEDWCISRQLWWGHRIPAWYHNETGEVYVDVNPPKDIENYTQDSDVLDTWFSSALWPFTTLGWPEKTPDFERYFPTSCLVTGYDIIFFWVSRMVFQSLECTGKSPFNKVVIHGLVRDEQGRKMSKSLGNGIDPIEVIKEFGTDALRYFLTSNSTPGLDMRFSKEKVQSSANYLNKIWNASRYILGILDENFIPRNFKKDELNALDQWIINRFEETVKLVTHHMDRFDFNNASNALYDFVYDSFCSFYLEMSKVTLQGDDLKQIEVTKQVLYKVIKGIILMIYPYTPFIAEEIYLNLPAHKESIMLEDYPKYQKSLIDLSKDEEVELLNQMIKDIRNHKVTNKLAPNAKLDLELNIDHELFDGFKECLSRFSFANSLNFVHEFTKKGTLYHYNLGDLLIVDNVDVSELKLKFEKEIKVLEAEVLRGEKMLSNPGFLAKAPKAKVDLETEKLAKNKEALKDLQEKLNNLK